MENQSATNNFESRNDRPWPNPYLDAAAIVGHTTATSCRLWLRTGRTGNFTLLLWSTQDGGKISLSLAVSNTKDTTIVADIEGLMPDTVYQYALADADASPAKMILGHDKICQFQTLPVQDSTFSFAFYSCHNPYKSSLFGASGTAQVVNIEMWEYLHAMLRRHQDKQELRFVIAGGDQVYADGVDSLNIWSYLKKNMRKVNGKLFPDQAAMQSWYRDIYRGYWGFPQVRRVFANFPMYMMWDDHELMDGWGSRYLKGRSNRKGDEMKRIFQDYQSKGLNYNDCRTLLARMEDAAKSVYEEYQHSHNPATEAGVYDYGFRHDRSAFYVLDGRGCRDINRDSHRILGKPQMARFKNWVDTLDSADTRLLFVTTAVPLLHFKPALVNADDNWLLQWQKLEDDLRDAWEHDLHDAERRELLEILFSAADRGIGVCILSGDVHTAAAFRMRDQKTGAVMYQLTSSAITYNTPRSLSWLVGYLMPDSGTSDDGYAYERLLRYTDSNFALIRADQDNQSVTFQIYGKQTAEHPNRETVLPMTHSLAKLELAFKK